MRRVILILFVLAAIVVPTMSTVSAGSADRARAKLVNTKISDATYENADFVDVIKEIARKTNTSIIVSKGVKAENYRVDLTLSNIKASSLLNIILRQNDLKLQVADGIFFIRTQEEAKLHARVSMRLYDLRDITMKIRNFKAPKIGLRDSEGNTVNVPDDDDDEEQEEPMTADEVMDLISENIESDLWGQGKHRLAVFRKHLVVTTSAEVHLKVARFLNQLRATR